ncbi:hypothetical protein JTB14_008952 [Gonioctena quinquepunctata]|nr:hypothetical protein JTB14_008952 [Gonioctena quinquepunctata]
MKDEPDKFFNSASDLIIEDAKTMEIRYLKTIMAKNDLLIMNQQSTISSLQEQIKLMQISNENQPMPSTSRRRNNLKADNTIPINNDTAIERNRNHLGHIVSGTEKTQTTDLFSDAAKEDMLRSDQDKDQVKTIEPKQGNSQLIKDWRTVLPRRNRNKNKKGQMIIGDNKDSELVRAVPKFVDLHVTRMKTDTTETSLSNLLRKPFRK